MPTYTVADPNNPNSFFSLSDADPAMGAAFMANPYGSGPAHPGVPANPNPVLPAVSPFAVARMTSQPFGVGQMSALQNMQRPGMNAAGGGMFGAPNFAASQALHPALYGRQQFAGGPHDILGWLQNRIVRQKPGMTPPGITRPGTLPPGVAGP